jgi:hypothetical protein
MADTDELHDALALLADYHDHEDGDAQQCAYCCAVAVVGHAVPALQAQVAAAAERYARAVADADAVRARLVAERDDALTAVAEARGLVAEARQTLADLTRECDEALGKALDDGVGLIAAERARQVTAEGWTPEHDDEHEEGELARAAVCYATPPGRREMTVMQFRGMRAADSPSIPGGWPWDASWWKPTPDNRVRELVKAGALIAAEIDRLRRATPPAAKGFV